MNTDINALVHVSVWGAADNRFVEIRNRFRTNLVAAVSPASARLGDDALTIRLLDAEDYHAADLADELRRNGVPCRRDRKSVRIPRGFVADLDLDI